MTDTAPPAEPSIDKILSLLPKESVELLSQCSETLQQIVLSTTGSVYRDCEKNGIVLDPIQNEVFINGFVRATVTNCAFFLTAIDRSNLVITQMTSAYQDLYNEVLEMQKITDEPVQEVKSRRFRRGKS